MNITQEVRNLLDDTLELQGRAAQFDQDTPLLGAVPELDSMAVVAVMTALEEHFGFTIDDDDIDGTTFLTFGNLMAFVTRKVA